jgi:hypothetical protein
MLRELTASQLVNLTNRNTFCSRSCLLCFWFTSWTSCCRITLASIIYRLVETNLFGILYFTRRFKKFSLYERLSNCIVRYIPITYIVCWYKIWSQVESVVRTSITTSRDRDELWCGLVSTSRYMILAKVIRQHEVHDVNQKHNKHDLEQNVLRLVRLQMVCLHASSTVSINPYTQK